ncbi:MAG: hypothetical protein M3N68_09045, partial [Actinomycetota bacterium]|nr:hypothetical protein [Actinomycetota bacterium]
MRAWVRAQPFFAMGEEAPRPRQAPVCRRPGPVVVPALLVLLFFLLVPSTPWVAKQAPIDALSGAGDGQSASPPAS